MLAGSGDIIPDHDTLHIRLDPLSAPRHTAAIAELCQALNTTDTVYPGTTLTLRYSVKPHRPPHTKLLSYVRHLTKLKVKPRVGEEVETPGVRCRAGRFAGSGGVGRGIC